MFDKTFGEQFKLGKELKISKKEIKKELGGLVINAIAKNIPNQKVGVLFSGGVDSSSICFILEELGVDFVCYTAALDEKGMEPAQDLVWAQKIAKKYKWKLKIVKVNLNDTEKWIKKTIKVIKSSNVVKVGVALPFMIALNEAKKDKIKYIYSGLGSEEIFAGYERHKQADDINKECLNGLKMIYKRDLSRDLAILKHYKMKGLLPFLDKELVDFALRIPAKYKIKDKMGKVIFRQAMNDLGLEKEFALRPKKAAQYGSKFDKAISKLGKREKKKKGEYLGQFDKNKIKLGALISGGKDSLYAMYKMKRQGYDIGCLIRIKSKNKFSYMFHTPNIDLVEKQANAMDIPLISVETEGKKEDELKDLAKALLLAKKDYNIKGIITGALHSNYQKQRIEKICEKLKLKCFSPLWHMDQLELMKELIQNKFEIIISSIAADGFDEKWLGRKIDEKMINDLIKLNQKIGINIAGEGGEFESLVLDCQLFKKKIEIMKAKKKMTGENNGFYIVEKVKLIDK